MSYLKCTDPNETGNYLVMENGQIGIWKKVAGQPRLFVPLTQITSFKAQEGQTVTLPGRYESTPSVFLCPVSICAYNGAANTVDQTIEITSPLINSLTNGQYSISGQKSELKTPANSVFLPIDIRYELTAYEDVDVPSMNKTWGPIYAPNIQSAQIGVFIIFLKLVDTIYWRRYYSYSQITLKVGVSSTTNSTIQWGSASSLTNSKGDNVNLIASVTAPGNYIWLNVAGTFLSTTYAATPDTLYNGIPFYWGHIFVQFIGGTITTNNAAFYKDGSFDCVVCGR